MLLLAILLRQVVLVHSDGCFSFLFLYYFFFFSQDNQTIIYYDTEVTELMVVMRVFSLAYRALLVLS